MIRRIERDLQVNLSGWRLLGFLLMGLSAVVVGWVFVVAFTVVFG